MERPYRSFIRSGESRGGRGRGHHRGYGQGSSGELNRNDEAWLENNRPMILAKPATMTTRNGEESTFHVESSTVEERSGSMERERRPASVTIHRGRGDEESTPPPTPRVFARVTEAVTRASSSAPTPDTGDSSAPAKDKEELTAGIRLITEAMEWCDGILEYLLDNSEYIVIGAIGPQGCGKSTVLSMLGGNDALDMYRQYIFRPASREAMETCRHQTTGINIYVTKTRLILLDCQAVFSPGILDDMLRTEKRYNFEFKTAENYSEIESVQLMSFMLQVCHTVLVCVDWFVDLNLIRQLRSADMLRAVIPTNTGDTVQYLSTRPVNVAFLHQRAKDEEFKPTVIRQRSEFLTAVFERSPLSIAGGVSLAGTRRAPFVTDDEKTMTTSEMVNYLPLPDMKLRGKTVDEAPVKAPPPKSSTTTNGVHFKGVLFDYEQMISDLKVLVRLLPRHAFANTALNERQWFAYASKIWDHTKKSHLIAEYGRSLP